MRNLNEFISEELLINEMIMIDAIIINESLNCKILKELAAQLYKGKKEEQEKLDKEYEEDKKKYSWAYKNSASNKCFREIFGNEDILWDKITDDDIEEYPATEDEKEQKKIDKKCREVIKGNNKILIARNKDGEFCYFVNCWGSVYNLKANVGWHTHQGSNISSNGRGKSIPQYEKLEKLQGKTIYIIDCSSSERSKIRRQRNLDKSGMILFDAESLRKIAEKNIERYKEIIRKNKANRVDNDDLLKEIKKVINKTAEFATMVAKDPITHADLLRPVTQLSLYVYDRREYHSPRTPRDKGYYSGVHGLLPMMMKYSDLLKDLSKDHSYDFQQRDFDAILKNMKESLEKAKELITQIEDLI